MTAEHLQSLLDDAARIEATDLYPARCRNVIAKLAAALRGAIADLEGIQKYGLALEQELKARSELTGQFVAMAASMDADFDAASPKESPPVEVSFTWAEGDQDFWLHMKLPDGKQAGINLGNPKTMIATACLRALTSKEAPHDRP